MQASRFVHTILVRQRLLTICVVLVFVPGCLPRTTTVVGTVTLDGQPLSIASDSQGTVIFQQVGGSGTVATGLLDLTGHFKLATGSSSEIAPGDYLVSVSVKQLLPKSEDAPQAAKLITPAKYSSASDSGLKANVMPGENQLSFDLSSASGDGSSSSPDSASAPPVDSQPAELPALNN